MIVNLIAQLDDADAVVRQDAAVALGDMGHQAAEAVGALRQRLLSAEMSFHDRTCAAWALSQIVAHGNLVAIADLLYVLQTETSSPDADDLRRHCGFAVEELSSNEAVLTVVRRSREADPYWINVSRMVAAIPFPLDFS